MLSDVNESKFFLLHVSVIDLSILKFALGLGFKVALKALCASVRLIRSITGNAISWWTNHLLECGSGTRNYGCFHMWKRELLMSEK